MKSSAKYLFILLVFLISSVSYIYAIELKHFTLESGLPSRTVYDVNQDSQGYIWIASEAGLSRYNGVEFKNFSTKDGLPRNEVVSLSNDGKGKIWLNLSGQFTYIEDSKIHTINEDFHNDLNWNFRALADSNDDIWITTKSGLFFIDHEKLKFIDVPWTKRVTKPKIGATFHILGNNSDTTYIRYYTSIYKVVGAEVVDSTMIPYKINDNSDFRYSIVMDLPHLYLHSGRDLLYRNLYSKEEHVIASNLEDVLDLKVQDDDLWISSRLKGLTKYKLNKDKRIEESKKLLADKYVSSFIHDRESNLWMCSYDNGLYFKHNSYNESIDNLSFSSSKENYFEIVKNFNDTLWFGSRYGYLIRLINGKENIVLLPGYKSGKMNRILDLINLGESRLLLSTDNGVFLLDNLRLRKLINTTAKKLAIRRNEILLNTFQSSIRTSPEDLLSISATQYGLANFKEEQILLDSRTFASYIDRNGNYWLANSVNGLTKFSKTDTIYFKKYSNLFLADIVDFTEDSSDHIYIATVGDGLVKININDNTFENLQETDGLSSNVVYSLEMVDDVLYVGSNKGISIIEDFTGHQDSSIYNISTIDLADGLISDEIKDIAVTEDYIYATSSEGPIKIARDFSNHKSVERAYIEEVLIEATSVPVSEKLMMKPGQYFISIKFNTLSFSSPYKRSYKYRLIGQSDAWMTTNSNEAHFHNLKPGEYTFQVSTIGSGGDSEDGIESIDLEVRGLFIESTLFKILLALAFIIFLNLLLNFINSIRRSKKLKSLVEQKTLELNTKVEELDTLNQDLERSNKELSEFAYICSHDLKTPLRNISSFSDLLYRKHRQKFNSEEKEYLQFVKGGINKMERVINDLLALSKVSSDRITGEVNWNKVLTGVRGELAYLIRKSKTKIIKDNTLPSIEFHGANAKQILVNLISNAIKYNSSDNPTIHIGSYDEGKNVTLYIKDNGIGIDQKYRDTIFGVFKRLHTDEDYEGTGIGLAICERIVTKFHGKIWVDSVNEEGSTFYISLPKTQLAYIRNSQGESDMENKESLSTA